MKIGVLGLGYVGLVTAAVLAARNNQVIGIDVDASKIRLLQSGKLPIFEPGLPERVEAGRNNLSFSTEYSDLSNCDAVFICVPTPNVGRKIDLRYVLSASEGVKRYNASADLVIKSTVLPGTARIVSNAIGMNVVSNPEFTREGSAVQDTEKPDRIVIGGAHVDQVKKIWEFTGSPMLVTTNENAELIKYASNAFLAVKISFINQIADLCERVPNTDVNVVAEGMGLDKRIGREFLRAGIGYGGSCFPKDTVAISTFAEEKGVDLTIVRTTIDYNEVRVETLVGRMKEKLGSLKGKKVCVLGLSFKDNTDDIRESRSIRIIESLKKEGAVVNTYDPVVRYMDDIDISSDLKECISFSDIVITATEWKDFSEIDPSLLKGKRVFDFRRIFDPKRVELAMGVGIGRD